MVPQERVRAGLVVFVDLADFVDDGCRGFTYTNHYNLQDFRQLLFGVKKRSARGIGAARLIQYISLPGEKQLYA